MELTDAQAYALIRAILVAKFSAGDSTIILGLPELDEVISSLLIRNYTDPRIARMVNAYSEEVSQPYAFPTVLKRLQLEIDSGLLKVEERSVRERVKQLLFPYTPSTTLSEYYIQQLL